MAAEIAQAIFVTGAPRSGTSLTSQVLGACGAWQGDVNPLFENQRIREKVVKWALREAGLCELGLYSHGDASPDPLELREKVVRIIRLQGYEGGAWAYKGAKLVFQWRAWSRAFEGCRWVAVWRDASEVADSLRRWRFMARKNVDADRVVAKYHERLREIPAISVHPKLMIEGDFSEIEWVVRSLGLRWDEGRVRDIVEPEKWGP